MQRPTDNEETERPGQLKKNIGNETTISDANAVGELV